VKRWFKSYWRKALGIILLLSAFFFTHRFFFLPGDWRTHDGVHFIRLYNLDKVLREGQFPPRWLPDLGKGYGYPFFNFYPPLAYGVGEIFYLLGFSFIQANKLSFILASLVGMAGIFQFAKIIFGKKGAFFSIFLWLFLPYRAVDLYVRGSLAEYWGISLLPWAFYFLLQFLKKEDFSSWIKMVLLLFLLFITHNITALFGGIWLALFLFFYLFLYSSPKKRVKKFFAFSFAFLFALGLAAFFIFPALGEKKFTYIQSMTSDYFAYYNHFPSFYQLFISRFWGYGGSNFGPKDEMSFQIGYLQWLFPLLSFLAIIVQLKKGKMKAKKTLWWGAFFTFSFWFLVFLTHQRSVFIWKVVPFLKYFQFPWRLLSLVGIASVLSTAFFFSILFKNRFFKKREAFLWGAICLLAFALNYSFFRPQKMDLISDKDYLSGDLWQYQQREFLFDYLPLTVKEVPEDYYQPPLILTENKGKIEIEEEKADQLRFTITDQPGTVTIRRFYFPGWKAIVNGKKKEISVDKNGFMVLKLEENKSRVDLFLDNTPVRTLGNTISLISWFILGSLVLIRFATIYMVKKEKK